MSILSVDQISPIGSGTTITLNATEVKTGNEITVGTGASIFSPAGNTLTFGTNNVERIRIKNDGNIGIGEVSPTHRLHVQGSGTEIARFEGANGARLKLRNSTNNIFLAYTDSSDIFQLGTNGQNVRVHVDVNGKVGINETSPDSLLHLTTNDSTAYSTSETNTVNSTNTLLRLENTNGSDGSGVNNYVGIYFRVGSGANSDSQLQYVRTGDNAGTFHFKARNAGSTYPNLMTIDSSGSVNKPKNPAFYAYLTTNNAIYSAGTIIPWTNTAIDTRSAFQTSGSDQGRFIVPTTGIYYFGWRLNRRDDSRFDIAIYQNGALKYIDELRTDYGSTNWQAESSHYLLSCTAGQKVDLRIFGVTNAGSGQFDGGGNGYYDAFFGWMIG